MPTKKTKPKPTASAPPQDYRLAAIERVLAAVSGLSKDDQRRVLKAALALVESVEPKVTTWTTA